MSVTETMGEKRLRMEADWEKAKKSALFNTNMFTVSACDTRLNVILKRCADMLERLDGNKIFAHTVYSARWYAKMLETIDKIDYFPEQNADDNVSLQMVAKLNAAIETYAYDHLNMAMTEALNRLAPAGWTFGHGEVAGDPSWWGFTWDQVCPKCGFRA